MTASGEEWQRLSPRMLLVHPVHEVLRQIPLLIGSVVLGSATGNPLWTLAGWRHRRLRRGPLVHHHLPDRRRTGAAADRCAAAQGSFGAAQQDSFGVNRRAAAAPAARADRGAGEHGPGGRGDAAFALDAVRAGRCRACGRCCWRIRCRRTRDGMRPGPGSAGALAAVLVALQPAELHRTGDDPGCGRGGLSGGSRLRHCRIRGSPDRGRTPRERFGVVASVAGRAVVVVVASAVLSVLRSLVTYGNLVFRRERERAAPRARTAAGA